MIDSFVYLRAAIYQYLFLIFQDECQPFCFYIEHLNRYLS